MEEKDTLRSSCEVGSPQECYHRQQQVQELVTKVDRIDHKYDTRIKEVEKSLGDRISTLEAKSDARDRTIEDKISDLDKHFSVIFEKNNTLIEGMTDMLGEVKESYKTIGGKLQDVTTKVEAMQTDVTRIDAKVGMFESNMNQNLHHMTDEIHAVEKEVHEVDNKSKVDIVTTLRDESKSKLSSYLIAGGTGAGIVGLIIAIVQHFFG